MYYERGFLLHDGWTEGDGGREVAGMIQVAESKERSNDAGFVSILQTWSVQTHPRGLHLCASNAHLRRIPSDPFRKPSRSLGDLAYTRITSRQPHIRSQQTILRVHLASICILISGDTSAS